MSFQCTDTRLLAWGITLDEDVYARLRATAERLRVPASMLLRMCFDDVLAQHERPDAAAPAEFLRQQEERAERRRVREIGMSDDEKAASEAKVQRAAAAKADAYPHVCWYLDCAEVSDEGGIFLDREDAAHADAAIAKGDAEVNHRPSAEAPHAFDRARLVRTKVRADALDTMTDDELRAAVEQPKRRRQSARQRAGLPAASASMRGATQTKPQQTVPGNETT